MMGGARLTLARLEAATIIETDLADASMHGAKLTSADL